MAIKRIQIARKIAGNKKLQASAKELQTRVSEFKERKLGR